MQRPRTNGPSRRAGRRLRMAAAALTLSTPVLMPPPTRVDVAERRVALMGTALEISVRMPRREDALAASEGAIEEVRRIEDLLTTWRDSPLSRLNRAPAGVEVSIDPELSAVLSTLFAWTPRTEGAF